MSYNGSREAVIEAIRELVQKDPTIVFVSADSKFASRAAGFAKEYPNNYVEVGIAEQCAVNVACGLAEAGMKPIVETYGNFLTGRAFEQMHLAGYSDANIKYIGLNAGMQGGEREGVTHQSNGDLGNARNIPGLTVLCPCDEHQVFEAIHKMMEVDGSVYVRIGSGREPVVYDVPTPPFEVGKARIVREYGNDVAVFSQGFVVGRAIEAVEALKARGVHATLVEVPTLKPVDVETISGVLSKCGKAVTFEDHYITGGLGTVVAEVIAEHQSAKLVRIALETYPESGHAEALLDKYGISVENLVNAAKKLAEEV
ncbi:MAG: transketolase [Clostridiales bacterium]|nr:transketolase [Clostridiales bacterium]